MSSATCVRETWKLTGDDAWRTLAATGRFKLVRDAFIRLRAADGFSHSRSLAYATSLVFVQGLIALVGLAVVLLAALVGASAMLTVGRGLSKDAGGAVTHLAWHAFRWPVALGLAAAAFAGILRWAPRRRQPHWSWLAFGGILGVAGWTIVTVLFGLAFRASSSFGDVYGSLAGVVALQIWTFLSAVAIFFGAAIAAQLEAVRSGTLGPVPRE